jgi:hypothetical protein
MLCFSNVFLFGLLIVAAAVVVAIVVDIAEEVFGSS